MAMAASANVQSEECRSYATKDYRYIQAAESLVRDYCSKDLSDDVPTPAKLVELSAQQQALRIPIELVYLAGLAEYCSPSKNSLARDELFLRLQRILYSAERQQFRTKFTWSPTLLPANDTARQGVGRVVENRLVKLARLADAAAAQLVRHEDANSRQSKAKQTATKHGYTSKKSGTASGGRLSSHANDTSEDADESEDDDERLIIAGFISGSRLLDNEENERPTSGTSDGGYSTLLASGMEDTGDTETRSADLWLKVQKRKPHTGSDERTIPTKPAHKPWTAQLNDSTRNEKVNDVAHVPMVAPLAATNRVDGASSGYCQIPSKAPARADNEEERFLASAAVECVPLETDTIASNAPKQPVECSTSTKVDGSDNQNQSMAWHSKVEQLEQELAARDQQLAHERRAAASALQAERDSSSEQVLALQLRLYISETRLKTYEDALSDHIASVTENIVAASPGRVAPSVTSTPLYSRGEPTSPRAMRSTK